MILGKIIVWLIVGAIAGTMAGRLATFSKQGFGYWTNFGLGMLGALIGGMLFRVLRIDLGLGELKITFEDLIAAFTGSLLLVVAWRFFRKRGKKEEPARPAVTPAKDDNPFNS
ncbi:putative membrane protein YeaQ/YmgE (transglycosylase-associated protein family) [Roseimicrobium gellanilyticum]|uniref:Putative membrane protein YeaQ/YmgE (Transglycosylase-associated protein family) n=1 Tax=Roseimicrobium gellanilyticum TaxID=748857 RepID=A0A366H2B9_9BACT|nr:GlsB/YeaQ/YmgE family stress response membrane protein [Roseimicrobium gellanilyticum]RBP35383.1 putative membrane protein YeaQ/YmgE (transglycosylase-associated protein family) [Roseimicrobium gellanilyticum]